MVTKIHLCITNGCSDTNTTSFQLITYSKYVLCDTNQGSNNTWSLVRKKPGAAGKISDSEQCLG